MDQERIGKTIREIRIKNKLSQKELADKYNVTYQAVSKWENGKHLWNCTRQSLISTPHGNEKEWREEQSKYAIILEI